MNLKIDGHSPIPIRRQLTEQLRHVIEAGGVPPDQALPSIRELAGFLGVNPNTVARVIDDLKRSGYVEARRGKGVFVAPAPPARPSPHLRETFLQDMVIRAAALGMTADDLSVGVLSLAGIRPAAVRGTVEVLLVECSPPELDFFARQLEAHLPVHVDKVLLAELPGVTRRPKQAGRWRAAVTSFCHLPQVERLLRQGGPGDRVARRGASGDPPPARPVPVGNTGGRGVDDRRDGPQSRALDRERRPAEHRARRGLPRRGSGTWAPGAASGRDRLLHRGGRARPGARGLHRAGADRRPGPRSAGNRNARSPPGARKQRRADNGAGREAARAWSVSWR